MWEVFAKPEFAIEIPAEELSVMRMTMSDPSTVPELPESEKTIRPVVQLPAEQALPFELGHTLTGCPRFAASLRARARSARRSFAVVVKRLFLMKSLKLGTAIAARMAAIVIVTRSSISVKPRFVCM